MPAVLLAALIGPGPAHAGASGAADVAPRLVDDPECDFRDDPEE